SQAHFEALCGMLRAVGVSYEINPRLVRGLDYYNRTVFEWITPSTGAQNAVCSGGRYDDLIAQLGGDATPAIGFAMGVERPLALIIGDDELARGVVAMKPLRAESGQSECPIVRLAAGVDAALASLGHGGGPAPP